VAVPVALGVRLPAVTQAPQRLGDFAFQQFLKATSNPEPEGFRQRVAVRSTAAQRALSW
jgi:hypothetical protein